MPRNLARPRRARQAIELEAQASEDFLAEIQGSPQRNERQSPGHGSGHGSGYGKKKRKRGSFLGDMLDFG